jgi:hypothetical protein
LNFRWEGVEVIFIGPPFKLADIHIAVKSTENVIDSKFKEVGIKKILIFLSENRMFLNFDP